MQNLHCEFVGELSENKDMLVLTYGVTYWDYLGWKDTFATPDNTQRQREYGQAFGIGNVYTPQIVLNGSAHSPRYSELDVRTMTLAETEALLELSVTDGQLVLDTDRDVVLVSFKPGWQEVPVDAGENHGRTLRMANVVENLSFVKLFDRQDLFSERLGGYNNREPMIPVEGYKMMLQRGRIGSELWRKKGKS